MTEQEIYIIQPKSPEFEDDVKWLVNKYDLVMAEKYSKEDYQAGIIVEEAMAGETISELDQKAKERRNGGREPVENLIEAVLGPKGSVPETELGDVVREGSQFTEGLLYYRKITRDGEEVGRYERNIDGGQSFTLEVDNETKNTFSLFIEQNGGISMEPGLNQGLLYDQVHLYHGKDFSDNKVKLFFLAELVGYLDGYLLQDEGE